jgi:hypothetical protein
MRPLGRPKHRWEDNTEMALRETGFEDADRIHRVYPTEYDRRLYHHELLDTIKGRKFLH